MRLHPSEQPRPYEPLTWAAAAFVAGILAAEYVGGGMLFWCGAAVAAGAAWAILFLRRRAGAAASLVPLLVLLAAAGGARYRAAVDPQAADVARVVAHGPRLVTLEGVVVQSPRQIAPPADVFLPRFPDKPGSPRDPDGRPQVLPHYFRSTLTVECRRVRVEDRWVAARGQVRVSVREPLAAAGEHAPQLGDLVHVTGVLGPMGRPANPGVADVGTYLRRIGVRAIIQTGFWEGVRVVGPAADGKRWIAGAVREWALKRLERIKSPEGRAVVSAIMFGRRDLLNVEAGAGANGVTEQTFIASGAAHFLAVSGLHVGVVAGIVLLACRLLGLGRRTMAAVAALVVLGYALMTELQPSVLRAAIMVWCMCLGWMVGRRPMFLNSLAAAAIIVLLVRPGDLFSAGFQLSFGIMLGLAWLADKVEEGVFRRQKDLEMLAGPPGPAAWFYRRFVRRSLALSVAAALVSIPLKAYRFHLVAWLAPVATLLILPLVFVLMAGGMVLVALGWIAPWLGDLLAAVPDGLARAIGGVVRALAAIPGGHFYLGRFGWLWLALAYALLAAWVWRARLGLSPRRLGIVALGAAAVFVWTAGPRAPEGVRARFLAVGSASTTLVELPGGRAFLYDVGSSLSYARAGEGTVAPALWAAGAGRIDAAFLSHAHFDHYKDILPVAKRFGVRQVFVPPTFLRARLKADKEVVEALLKSGIHVTYFAAGDRLTGTGRAEVAAVWPRGPASQTKSVNDGSLVLSVADGPRRLLLAGDLEAAGIAALLETAPDLAADAMLWPHHGGDAEAVGRLAAATGAKAIVVSSRRRLSGDRAPAWVAGLGARCYATADHGMVTVELRPESVAVEHFLEPGARWPAVHEPGTGEPDIGEPADDEPTDDEPAAPGRRGDEAAGDSEESPAPAD